MGLLQKGDVVAGFVVKDRIGHGGMGDVYLVRDEKLAVDRALKVISLTGPGFTGSKAEAIEYRARFAREARALARLHHPNIIDVHATGEFDDKPYLIMSYFPSTDARRWLNDQKPSIERVQHVALQVARGLAHAHERGVLHRDIKLGNLLVGKNDQAMLIDFGLAKSTDDADLTRVGRTMGTFSYLAPEYVKESDFSGKPVHTIATELWAVGCLFYALTCGESAFREKDEKELLRLIARSQFEPISRRVPETPATWATLIHQLMEPDVARRLPSAAELVARLESICPRPLASPPKAAPEESIAGAAPAAPPAPLSANARAPAAIEFPTDAQAKADKAVVVEDVDVVEESAESLFDHGGEETGATAEASVLFPQPSFQLPPERVTSARMSARKKLVLPIAAAVAVLAVGAGLIFAMGQLGGRRPRSTAYVDPAELQRKQRAASELNGLSQERNRRASMQHVDIAPMPAVPTFTSPTADASSLAVRPESGTSQKRAQPRRAVASAQQSGPAKESNPWLERYGTRASYNTSSGAAAATVVTAAATQPLAVAGTRIPVRVTSVIASAPLGPVIAVVQSTTKLGTTDIPRGAELHGRVTGAEGPRVLVEFSFALVGGRSVSLKGSALGQDGRAGVPGARNSGGISDIGAGAAGGGAQALLDGAVALVDNGVAAGALRGATAPLVGKAGRLDNEEDLVVADRGAKFFVYVESVL